MIAAVILPVAENWKNDPQDSFPLSYYPMFSRAHGERQTETYLVGLDGSGKRLTIHYRYAGRGGANQVRKQLRKIGRRPEQAKQLLRSVAERIAGRKEPALAELREIRLVRGTYDLEDYFLRGIKKPLRERVIASLRFGADE